MDYNELKTLIEKKKFTIKRFSDELNFTSTGFKKGIESGSFPINKVSDLCRLLGITPNEFFGWSEEDKGTIVAHHIGGNNEQNGGAALAILSAQLKEKDSQIKDLLTILKTGK